MDDSLSVNSSDSATTSDEYEFVSLNSNILKVPSSNTNEQPLLKIADNGDLDHLQKCLGELLSEENCSSNVELKTQVKSVDEMSTVESSLSEELRLESHVTQECTLFGCISYLGSAAINAPKSKTEITRNMAILNEQSCHQAIKVSLSIPNIRDGTVVLFDASNNSVMAKYETQRIMYYDNGPENSKENSCFAFTYCHGDTQETALFQCHVFRCDIPEAASTMQNFCVLISTLFVSIQLKSTRSALTEENQSKSDYRLRPVSEAEYGEKLLTEEDEESGFQSYKNSRDSDGRGIGEYPTLNDADFIRYLLNRYYNELKKNISHQEIKQRDEPMKYRKRALTMLSRWKPFQITNTIGGNGRHVIRSAINSRSEQPYDNKMQIMGRPFRWG